MSNAPKPEQSRKLLDIITAFAVYCLRRDRLYDTFADQRPFINRQLAGAGIQPLTSDGEYASNFNALTEMVRLHAALSGNTQKSAGAVLWRLGQTSLPHDEHYYKLSNTERGREECRYRKQMTVLLTSLPLDLSARDKINYLDYLGFKYSDMHSRELYKRFSNYAIDDDYSAVQSVKLMMKIYHASKKEGSLERLRRARYLFENASAYASYLDHAAYIDKEGVIEGISGKTYVLNGETKDMIGRRLQKCGDFSAQCHAFFSNNEEYNSDIFKTMAAVVNRVALPGSETSKKVLLSKYRAQIEQAVNDENRKMNNRDIENYIHYLCAYATYHHDQKGISTASLRQLLSRNSDHSVELHLFDEVREHVKPSQPVNKRNVLKAADIYVNSFSCTHWQVEEFNPDFCRNMTEMFSDIVTNCGYSKKEVRELCGRISGQPDAAAELKAMSCDIMRAYTSPAYRAAQIAKAQRGGSGL